MSARHTRTPMNSSRARARKRTLARRDGAWCVYCGRLFADLRQATIDHVVPLCLFPTWRAEHTVLACTACNNAKGNRLPLLLSVLLTPDPYAVDWVLLARLAAARESAGWEPGSADSAPDRMPDRLRSDQPEERVRLALVGAAVRTRPRPAVSAAVPDWTARLGTLREAA